MTEIWDSIMSAPSFNQFVFVAGSLLVANIAIYWFVSKYYKDGNKPAGKSAVDPEEWREFELVEKRKISPNTVIYRFKLPTSDSILGLPIGQHLQLKAIRDGKEFLRSYTPITLDDERGYFELLVKTYPQGNASRYLDELNVGEKAAFRGPRGKFQYRPNMAKHIGMIAGGTGITPILQVIKAILRNPQDTTKMTLIFANVAVHDILLYDELQNLAHIHSERFNVHFVLNEAPDTDWTGSVGFVTGEVIKKNFPESVEDMKVLMCGPPPMMNAMMKILTEELEYPAPQAIPSSEDMLFRF